MRLPAADILDYAADLVALLERSGVEVVGPEAPDPLEVRRMPGGTTAIAIAGQLPAWGATPSASLLVRETYEPVGSNTLERTSYAFELIDHGRGFRRAFHQHDDAWFVRHHLVVVHEHCERPIGFAPCAHFEGTPVRDGFAGILALLDAWIIAPPDCSTFRCLG